MVLFSDLVWERHPLYAEGQGIMARVVCQNGYRASIVRTPHSHGGTTGLYEIRIMHPHERDTDIPEVKGWLTPAHVSHELISLHNLPPVKERAANEEGKTNEEDLAGE